MERVGRANIDAFRSTSATDRSEGPPATAWFTMVDHTFLGIWSTLPAVRQDFVTGVKGGRARAEG